MSTVGPYAPSTGPGPRAKPLDAATRATLAQALGARSRAVVHVERRWRIRTSCFNMGAMRASTSAGAGGMVNATQVSRSLRCLVIVPSLARGGAELQAVLAARSLQRRGLSVRLFAQGLPDALVRDDVTGSLAIEIAKPGRLPAQTLELRRAIEAFAPDAVITFLRGASGLFAATRAASRAARSAAWIVAVRGNLRLLHVAQSPVVFGAQLLWHRTADRICTNSAALATNILAMDGALASKLIVVPNVIQPFDVDAAAARKRVEALVGSGVEGPVIGCIGSFQDERNYQLLADALPIVLRAKPGAHLLLIGRTTGDWVASVAARFRARVDALGLGRRVTLAGEIAKARELLAGFDVFALTSKLEGSSNALAEAMLAGAATVTVPVADAQELLGGAGVVSRGWTAGTFAEAVLTAMDRANELRARAAERGRQLAGERSADRVGAQWEALVREAIDAAHARADDARRA